MDKELIPVRKVKDVQVFVSPSGEFFCELNGETLKTYDMSELVNAITEKSRNTFDGEFYVKAYDGIDKFKAKTRVWSDYEGAYKVFGTQIDGAYGTKRQESFKEDELYPMSEANNKVFKRYLELNKESNEIRRKASETRYRLKMEPK